MAKSGCKNETLIGLISAELESNTGASTRERMTRMEHSTSRAALIY